MKIMKGRKKREEMKIWGRGKVNGILKTFKKCRKCGGTDRHYGKGLCHKCYQSKFHKSYERKDIERHRELSLANYYKKKLDNKSDR